MDAARYRDKFFPAPQFDIIGFKIQQKDMQEMWSNLREWLGIKESNPLKKRPRVVERLMMEAAEGLPLLSLIGGSGEG